MANDKSKSLLTLVRLSAVLVYGYSVYYFETNVTTPIVRPYGKFKYLTYLDLLIQLAFFTLVSLISVLNLKSKSLTKLVEFLFYSLAFPIALIVSVTFWTIYSINRELIFPVILEKYYPNWLNHSTHTLVLVYVVMELYLANHKVPKTRPALTMLFSFSLVYSLWVLFIAFTHDFWVYPFLSVMNWPVRIAFFASSTVFNCIFYFVGVKANKYLQVKPKPKKARR